MIGVNGIQKHSVLPVKRLLTAAMAASVLALPATLIAEAPASAEAACNRPTKERRGMDTYIVTSCQGEGQVTLTASCLTNSQTWTWHEKVGSNRDFTLKNRAGTAKMGFSYA